MQEEAMCKQYTSNLSSRRRNLDWRCKFGRMKMANEDRELKEITYHKNMGDDEHSRNSKMKWLGREKSFQKRQRWNAHIYMRKSSRVGLYTHEEDIRNKNRNLSMCLIIVTHQMRTEKSFLDLLCRDQ